MKTFCPVLNGVFQSTLSVRRATYAPTELTRLCSFQSTLSVRRATATDFGQGKRTLISIHALREESDSRARHCAL